MQKRTRWAIVVGVALFLLFYTLSYAPALRGDDKPDPTYALFNESVHLYGPVEWLIDNTPLRELLLVWAAVWGVREEAEHASTLRKHPELIAPQMLDIPAETFDGPAM
jgi:hypothetical protein